MKHALVSPSGRYRVHGGHESPSPRPQAYRRESSSRHNGSIRDQPSPWPSAPGYDSVVTVQHDPDPDLEYRPAYPSASPAPYPGPAVHNAYQQLPYADSGYHEQRSYTSPPPPPSHPPPSRHSHSASASYANATPQHGTSSLARQQSSASELSMYSLSHYKPSKPRFRIEHEGNGLVVLPPDDAHASPPSPPPPPEGELVPHWPPSHVQSVLSRDEAEKLVAHGAPLFEGELREVPSGAKGQYHFFAFAGKEYDEETDVAPFQSDSFGDMSSAPEGTLTDALERPAMAHAFGTYPGTVTLACYVAMFGSDATGFEIAARGKVRKLTMLYVLDRLRRLQAKGIEEDPAELYYHLYENLLHDSRKLDYSQPHYSLPAQISDLVAVLCRPVWVDFSQPENQTVAYFITHEDPSVSNRFFHQLLLSIELHLRIKSISFKHVADMPEKVRWDLMLAQRWLENVEIEPPRKVRDGMRHGEQKSNVSFTFPNKKTQVEALKNFAWTLKWPNMYEVECTLSEQEDPDELLEDRSTNCMSWFTGLMLPGKSMPWTLMNALIDCDPDTPEEFKNMRQTMPNIGFQYRGHTYWSWECIVGRVLGAAAGVTQIAGWIGPCSASADLDRSEVAVIKQARHRGLRLTPNDVRRVAENSDPIGPETEEDMYPVTDYQAVTASTHGPVDTIRIERLNFAPSPCNPKGAYRQLLPSEDGSVSRRPTVVWDASITFAVTVEKRARSWKVSLRHDTPFMAAYPCQHGPHVLFCDYRFRLARVDELVDIQSWSPSGGIDAEPSDAEESEEEAEDHDVDEVLVINAFGVPDNEVFARAWCSFWGLPAMTADVNRTCMACAVREAYAALVSVVILTNRQSVDVAFEEVDRLMENL